MGHKPSKFKQVEYVCAHCKEVCKPNKMNVSDKPVNEFTDDQGNKHIHDPNQGVVILICSKGHRSEAMYGFRCLTCGWMASLPA